ncbi:TPA: TPM domain-containing protein [Candidatus Bipolaricaulota bacterium]|nr:TPM domain-containing protein [Candidatus Bipolaricaulota bacterium]
MDRPHFTPIHVHSSRIPVLILTLILTLASTLLLFPSTSTLRAEEGEGEVPEQRGYISDYAEIIDAKTEMALTLILKALEERYKTKLVILTVETTAPLGIEDYSAEVFREWGLGRDDLLFLVALGDGRVRLDPGRRLNRVLTDSRLREILDQEIMPQFEAGDFSQGVLHGTVALTSAIKEVKKREAQARALLWLALGLGMAALAAMALFLLLK